MLRFEVLSAESTLCFCFMGNPVRNKELGIILLIYDIRAFYNRIFLARTV